ncbi:hypothetical protein F5Y08DRAFT_309159 [Xylaria arbuscula]|nr:hypothetical protein F5Y08DRAFT_309159 [Xylaria arbuscula]
MFTAKQVHILLPILRRMMWLGATATWTGGILMCDQKCDSGWLVVVDYPEQRDLCLLLTLPYPLRMSQLSLAGPYPDRIMAMFCEAP